MEGNIIERLFSSFSDLEKAITSARGTLEQRDFIPQEVIKRLHSYDSILAKQRKLAEELCVHINNNDLSEISRHVGLINGLSSMIRDDARAILASLSANPEANAEEDTDYIC